MARACISRQITKSDFLATALLIAGVPIQSIDAVSNDDVTSSETAAAAAVTDIITEEGVDTESKVVTDEEQSPSDEAALTDFAPSMPAINENPGPVNEAQIFRKIAETASVIPLLLNAASAAIPKAAVFEEGPLTEESKKAAEAGEMTEQLRDVAGEWAQHRLPETPLKDTDDVIALFRNQFLAAENYARIHQAYQNHLSSLLDELCKLKNTEGMIKFLHSVDPALQAITPEAVESKKMRMQQFMQYFLREAPQN